MQSSPVQSSPVSSGLIGSGMADTDADGETSANHLTCCPLAPFDDPLQCWTSEPPVGLGFEFWSGVWGPATRTSRDSERVSGTGSRKGRKMECAAAEGNVWCVSGELQFAGEA